VLELLRSRSVKRSRSEPQLWVPPTSAHELLSAADDANSRQSFTTQIPDFLTAPFEAFVVKAPPADGDWLAGPGVEDRGGQSVKQFLTDVGMGGRPTARRALMYTPTRERATIYLVPVGPMDGSPPIDVLCDFVQRWFQLPCVALHALVRPWHTRRNRGAVQTLTSDPLDALTSEKAARPDAFAVLGVTMSDLYPGDHFEFVYGEADQRRGVGIFSFARYHPCWARKTTPSGPLTAEAASTYLRRCLKVVVHELGHLFQMQHCVFWECIMNGANHLGEFDAQPLRLCPADVRKLACSLSRAVAPLDILHRYAQLRTFYATHELVAEEAWVAERLAAAGITDDHLEDHLEDAAPDDDPNLAVAETVSHD